MSKYTTEVRFICESNSGLTESEGFNSINDIIVNAAPQVFNFDFPIFDEDYRLPLEVKILRHYYTREICEETVGLWKLRLQDRLNVIMPYYNQLYESVDLEFNPFHDVDLHISRNSTGETEGKTSENIDTSQNTRTETKSARDTQSDNVGMNERKTANNEETNNNSKQDNVRDTNVTGHDLAWNLYSDTPQGDIDGIQGWENVSDGNGGTVRVETLSPKYLTNAQKNTDDNTTVTHEQGTTNNAGNSQRNSTGIDKNEYANNTNENETSKVNADGVSFGNENRSSLNNVTNTEEYIENITGKRNSTSYARLLMEYRESLINIDEMIIDELSDLFFGLW